MKILYFLRIEIEDILFLLYLQIFIYLLLCVWFSLLYLTALIEWELLNALKFTKTRVAICKMDAVSGSDLLLNFRTSCCWNSFRKKRENRVLYSYRRVERRARGCENEIRLVCSKLLLTYQRSCRNGYLCYDTCYISKSHLYIHSKHNIMEFAWRRDFSYFRKRNCICWGKILFPLLNCVNVFSAAYMFVHHV